VLAAGAGTRFGGPKGLARTTAGEPWVRRAVTMLAAAGCDDVLVAVGARGDDVAALVPPSARVVTVPRWADGLSATLLAGLDAVAAPPDGGTPVDALVVTPVDTPEAPPAAVVRVLGGRPGHPVLLGRDHWDGVRATLTGDTGAGRYLAAHGALDVECGDLWSGDDIDLLDPSAWRHTSRHGHGDDPGAGRGA
jgi:CTP:molybdopterin cytidylyltransferase MocA